MAAIGVELWYSCNVLLSVLFSRWLVPNKGSSYSNCSRVYDMVLVHGLDLWYLF